jgi:hypothetical protein
MKQNYLKNLVHSFRYLSESEKKYVYQNWSGKPIETLSCDQCYDTGIIEYACGTDDYERDVCEFCENYEIKRALTMVLEIKNTFEFLNLRYRGVN